MEFVRNISQLHSHQQNCVATIGNFDGVHLGHQTILRQVATRARDLHLATMVIIFEPQPQEFFSPTMAPPRLTRLREKLITMRHYEVKRVLRLAFNTKFAAFSEKEFIQKVLVNGLKVRHLVVGDDFHFAQGRAGNFVTLQQAGIQYGFTVESQNTFILGGKRVSSTRVRQVLQRGDMQQAKELLGHPYTLCGRVSYGQQLGRNIGFPTANIFLHRQASPITGVFSVNLRGVSTQPLAGIANLGTRPTVNGKQLLLEVHIFDFNQNIYGRYVEVEFLHKIRDEQRFNSLDALQKQIELDSQLARKLLA